jgi:release factor glutamine methyltransferase
VFSHLTGVVRPSLVTVLEAIQKSTEFLTRKDIESPRLQAELLLAHVLHLPRMKLYLNFERPLSAAETDAYREIIRRRSRFEPLQHIVGSSSFCGIEILSTPQALIPRPETELLAEFGWQFLNGRENPTAIDFGAGTGCIAIALAVKCPGARIIALDVSSDAIALARKNAVQNQVDSRIDFFESDGFAALPGNTSVDLIISNPPYIATAEIATLAPEVQADPVKALDGGLDGLDYYRRLATEAKKYLRADGKIMLEFGDGQAADIEKLLREEKWIVEAIKEDYSHRARFIFAKLP